MASHRAEGVRLLFGPRNTARRGTAWCGVARAEPGPRRNSVSVTLCSRLDLQQLTEGTNNEHAEGAGCREKSHWNLSNVILVVAKEKLPLDSFKAP